MYQENPTGPYPELQGRHLVHRTILLTTCGYTSISVGIVNHSEISLIEEMSNNNGIRNQAFSSGIGQQPMTMQPKGEMPYQNNNQRASENTPKLFGFSAPGYCQSFQIAFVGWLCSHGPGISAYRNAQRLEETKPCLKEGLTISRNRCRL